MESRLARFAGRAVRFSATLPDSLPIRAHLVSLDALSFFTFYSPQASAIPASGAASRRDFIGRLRIADKEAREARFWLAVCLEFDLADAAELETLVSESEEIISILSASIRTATRTPHDRP